MRDERELRPFVWGMRIAIGISVGFVVIAVLVAIFGSNEAQADPWCGPGSYYDFNHDICQGFRSPPPTNGQVPPNYYYGQDDQ